MSYLHEARVAAVCCCVPASASQNSSVSFGKPGGWSPYRTCTKPELLLYSNSMCMLVLMSHLHEARVAVVLDVVSLYELLHAVQRRLGAACELQDDALHHVHLRKGATER